VFYGSKNPTNSVKALQKRVLRFRLESHQVYPTL